MSSRSPRVANAHRRKGLTVASRALLAKITAAALIALTLTAIVVIAYARLAHSGPALDAQQCSLAGVEREVVVLIDQTDPLLERHLRAVIAEIRRRIAASVVGTRIWLLTLPGAGQEAVTKTLYRGCKPRDGSDASEWLDGSEGRRQMKQVYEEKFVQPLESALNQLAAAESTPRSPIIEALAALASDPAFQTARQHSVLVASDLIENSEICNQYRPRCKFDVLEKRGLAHIRALRGALAATDITALQLTSDATQHYQSADHQAFWKSLFAYAGVAEDSLRIERL